MISRPIATALYMCLVCITVLLFIFSPLEYDKGRLGWLLLLVAASYLIYMFSRESNRYIAKQFLLPSKLFLLGYTIVYFQNIIDIFFDYGSLYHELSILYPQAIIRSGLLSVMGLQAFFIGYLLFNTAEHKPQLKEKPQSYTPINLLKLFSFSLILFYLIFVNKSYLWGGYGTGIGMGAVASLISYFLEGSIYGTLLLYTLNLKAKNTAKKKISLFGFIKGLGFFNVTVVCYLLTVVLSGDRGAIIYITLGYFYCYLYTSSKIFSTLKSFILIFIAGALISILGIARTMRSIESKGEQIALAAEILSTREATSLSPATKELANSLRCLHAVVEERERLGTESLHYGRFASYQLLSSLPFSGSVVTLSGIYGSGHTSSAEYITELIQGKKPKYGDGTAAIAELYLDFGATGVIFAMLLFGIFMRRADEFTARGSTNTQVSIFFFAVVMLYFAHSISIARSTLLLPLKKAIATFAICYLYTTLNRLLLSTKKSIIQ